MPCFARLCDCIPCFARKYYISTNTKEREESHLLSLGCRECEQIPRYTIEIQKH